MLSFTKLENLIFLIIDKAPEWEMSRHLKFIAFFAPQLQGHILHGLVPNRDCRRKIIDL